MSHKKHHHILVSVTGRQSHPDFTVRGHSCDDINFLAKYLFSHRIVHVFRLPATLVECRKWYRALINIYDPFKGLVHFEHLLCIKASENFASLCVTLYWDSIYLAVREAKLILHDGADCTDWHRDA